MMALDIGPTLPALCPAFLCGPYFQVGSSLVETRGQPAAPAHILSSQKSLAERVPKAPASILELGITVYAYLRSCVLVILCSDWPSLKLAMESRLN